MMQKGTMRRIQTEAARSMWAAVIATGLLEGVAAMSEHAERPLSLTGRGTTAIGQWILCGSAALLFAALAATVRVAPRVWMLVAALPAAAGTWPLTVALTSGAWINAQGFAPWVRLGATATVTAGTIGVIWALYVSSFFGRPRPRAALALALGLLGVMAARINIVMFPGQYPAAHLLLIATSSAVTLLGVDLGLNRVTEQGANVLSPKILGLGAVCFGVTGSLLTLFLLPPSRSTTVELLRNAERTSYLLEALIRAPATEDLYDELVTLDLQPTKTESTPRSSSRLTIPNDWNILLLVVDSLRADVLPPARERHRKQRFTEAHAPFLSRLAEKSYRFERVYAGATYTHRSMPSMFHSRHPFDGAMRGTSLAELMTDGGRTPVAVVSEFFSAERSLLKGFATVEAYLHDDQNAQRGLVARVLAAEQHHPFFAWIHYYAVHSPGWNGAALPRDPDRWPEQYPKTVRWVDGEIAHLFEMLQTLGIREKTLVVVASDHGEGLMDTGFMWHGFSVRDEGAAVPMLIHFPDRPGALVQQTVGNIDIVPTLSELMGAPARPSKRGRSLVPFFGRESSEPSSTYFVESGDRSEVAVVRGTAKHVLNRRTGVHVHYDLSVDPAELDDIFDPTRLSHRDLVGALVREHPEEFTRGFKGTNAQALLERRLAEASANAPLASLRFLAKLVRLYPSESRIRWTERIFMEATDRRVQWMLLDELFELNAQGLGPLIARNLELRARTSVETDWLFGLADLGITNFGGDAVAELFQDAAQGDRSRWVPWLRMLVQWELPGATYGNGIGSILGAASADPNPDPNLLRLALTAASRLRNQPAPLRTRLFALIADLLVNQDQGVRAGACIALGHLGDPAAEGLLRERLTNQPLVIRMAALDGLTALLGVGALSDIERLGEEPALTVNSIRKLGELGSPEGLRFISRVEGANPNTKRAARTARALIAGQVPKAE